MVNVNIISGGIMKLMLWMGILIIVSIANWFLFLAKGYTLNEIYTEL